MPVYGYLMHLLENTPMLNGSLVGIIYFLHPGCPLTRNRMFGAGIILMKVL